MKVTKKVKKLWQKFWKKALSRFSHRISMFRFKKAKKLRIRADHHEQKASTPALILKICSERFGKLKFNYSVCSDETTDNIMCQKVDYILPRRKGWGKPISAARMKKIKKDRAKIEDQDRERMMNRKRIGIAFTVA